MSRIGSRAIWLAEFRPQHLDRGFGGSGADCADSLCFIREIRSRSAPIRRFKCWGHVRASFIRTESLSSTQPTATKSSYQDESRLSGRTSARPTLRARLSRPCRCHSRGQAERILNSSQGLQCRVARGFGIRRRPDGATEGFGLRHSPASGHFLEQPNSVFV